MSWRNPYGAASASGLNSRVSFFFVTVPLEYFSPGPLAGFEMGYSWGVDGIYNQLEHSHKLDYVSMLIY